MANFIRASLSIDVDGGFTCPYCGRNVSTLSVLFPPDKAKTLLAGYSCCEAAADSLFIVDENPFTNIQIRYLADLALRAIRERGAADEAFKAEAFKAGAGEFFDVQQAALILSVSKRTIMNYVRSGRLQGVKVGGKWRFSGETLQRFLRGD